MKVYPQIELSEWTMVGGGYNGQAYVSDAHPGVMLKLVTSELGSAQKVEQEFFAARTAYETGLPTPKVYEIVRNGKDHGYLCQIIEGKKDVEAFNRELRPYAALDTVRSCYLHPMNAPEFIAFFKSRVTQDLS